MNFRAILDASGFHSGINSIKGALSGIGDHATGSFRKLEGIAVGAGKAIGMALIAGVALFTTALVATGALFGKSAMEWEKMAGGVFKTTGLEKGTAEANKLNDALLELYSTTKGASKADITTVAGGLGSLGIANDQIVSATKSILQAQGAFGVSAQDATSQLGVISTLWEKQTEAAGGTAKMFDKAGSSINELGNKYAATEKNLLSYLAAAGGVAGTFKQNLEATAAFGALLETKGIKGDEAATALRSMTLEGLMAGGKIKGYQVAAQMLGIGDQAMKDKLSKDLYGTIIEISTAVSKLPLSEFDKTLKMKEIFGSFGFSAAAKVADQGKKYNEMLKVSTQGYKEGTSMAKEYEKQTNNLTDALSGLWNSIDTAGIKVFSDALTPLGEKVNALAAWVREATPTIIEFFRALSSGDWSKVGSMLKDAFTIGITAVKNSLSGLGTFIFSLPWGDWFNSAVTTITTTLGSVGEKVKALPWMDWFNAVMDIVTTVWETLPGKVKPALDKLADMFGSGSGVDWSGAATRLITAIGTFLHGAISSVLEIGSWIYDKATEWVSSGGPKRLGEDIANAIAGGIKALFGSGEGNFDFWGAVKAAFGAYNNWRQLALDIATGIGEGIYTLIQPHINKLHDYFTTALATIVGGFVEAGLRMGNAIVQGLSGAQSEIKRMLQSWYDAAVGVYNYIMGIPDKTVTVKVVEEGGGGGGGGGSSEGGGQPKPERETLTNYEASNFGVSKDVADSIGGQSFANSISAENDPIAKALKNVRVLEVLREMGANVVEPKEQNKYKIGTNDIVRKIQGGPDAQHPDAQGYYRDRVGNLKQVSLLPVGEQNKDMSGDYQTPEGKVISTGQKSSLGEVMRAKNPDLVDPIGAISDGVQKGFTGALDNWTAGKTLSEEDISARRKASEDAVIKGMGGIWYKEPVAEPIKQIAKEVAAIPKNIATAIPTLTGNIFSKLGIDQSVFSPRNIAPTQAKAISSASSSPIPVTIANTASNPAIMTSPYDAITGPGVGTDIKWVSDMWARDEGSAQISAPAGQLRAPSKAPGLHVNVGSIPLNPWTDEPLIKVNTEALIKYYDSMNLSLKPTGSLAVSNTKVAASTETLTKANKAQTSSIQELSPGVFKITNDMGALCEAISPFGIQQESMKGMFKEQSIIIRDSLTPAQREAYSNTQNLAGATAEYGATCEAVTGFTLDQEAALAKVSTSFIGTTADYERLGLGAAKTSQPVQELDTKLVTLGANSQATHPAVTSLGAEVLGLGVAAVVGTAVVQRAVSGWNGIISEGTMALARQYIQANQFSNIVGYADVAGNKISVEQYGALNDAQKSQFTAIKESTAITAEMCAQAYAQSDEYGQMTLGTGAVINSLVKLTAENGKFCEAMSDFGLAQENTLGIFKQSYIGPTSGYAQFKELDAAIAKAAGEIVVGAQDAADIQKETASDISNKAGGVANENYNKAVAGGDYVRDSGRVLYNDASDGGNFLRMGASYLPPAGADLAGKLTTSSMTWQTMVGLTSGLTKTTYTGINTDAKTTSTGINTAAVATHVGINAQWTNTGTAKSTEWTSAGITNSATFKTGIDEGVKVFVNGAWVAANSIAEGAGYKYSSTGGGGTGGYVRDTSKSWGNGPYVGPFYGGWANGGPGAVGKITPGEVQPPWMPRWTWQAEGGLVSKPTFTVTGEAGPELILPLSDPRRTKELLNQYLPYQAFASGGLIGGSARTNQQLVTVSFVDFIDSIVYGSTQIMKNMKAGGEAWIAGINSSVSTLDSCWSRLESVISKAGPGTVPTPPKEPTPPKDPATKYPERITLRAYGGQYVTAEPSGKMVADRANIGDWEGFSLIPRGDGYYSLQSSSGKFVSLDESGSGQVVANREASGTWENFTLIDLGNGFVAFRGVNGKYLSAEGGGGSILGANRDKIEGWESFKMGTTKTETPFTGSPYPSLGIGGLISKPTYLLTGEAGDELILPLNDPKRVKELLNKYLPYQAFAAGGLVGSSSRTGQTLISVSFTDFIDSVVYGSTQFIKNMKEAGVGWNTGIDSSITKLDSCWARLQSILSSISTTPGTYTPPYNPPAETPPKPPAGYPSKISLRAYGGQYLTAEGGGGGNVIANRPKAETWETFGLRPTGDGYYTLQVFNGQFVSLEKFETGTVMADRTKAETWENFSLVDLGNGNVAFRGVNGKYLAAEGGGGGLITASRSEIQGWETFKMAASPFAEGGYVNYKPGGTYANIAEQGDEYVVPEHGALVLKGGSSKPSISITLDYHPTIPSGLDKSEIQELLREDHESLLKEIETKITEAY